MDFSFKSEIVNLEAFQPVLNELKQIDANMGENIEKSLRAAVSESHALLKAERSKEQLQLSLMKEQLIIQAQSSQYLILLMK
ncbi:hypothetical protein [Neobacillus sp. SAB-20_R2A]|uniref:hypothetical protein n=1 Tax=Neobacillus sp. SAB-20_R2A TaxID=3120519 RepID=UPI003C6E8C17